MGAIIRQEKEALTLIELLVVLVIIGILLSLAVPSYRTSIERSRGKYAEFNLLAIYNAQKRYKLAKKTYYACDTPALCTPGELENETRLGVYVNDPYFDYGISADSTTFTATATRKAGSALCSGQTMTVTQQGSEVDKGCDVW